MIAHFTKIGPQACKTCLKVLSASILNIETNFFFFLKYFICFCKRNKSFSACFNSSVGVDKKMRQASEVDGKVGDTI